MITYTKFEIAILKKIVAVKQIEFVNYCGIGGMHLLSRVVPFNISKKIQFDDQT